MGTALREFEDIFVAPQSMAPLEEARTAHAVAAMELSDIYSRAKGRDIGRVVVDGLNALGRRPDSSPIFSADAEPEKLEGFLEKFGVTMLHKLEDSVPVILSGCSVEIEEVMKYNELLEHEKAFGGVHTPAVRIHFIPREY